MASIKRGAVIASILLVVAVTTSACDLRYSTPPAATNTPISQNFFTTPMGQTPSMSDVEIFGTGTARALTGTPVPGAVTNTPVGITPQAITNTPTPVVNLPNNPTLTPTATLAVSGPTATLIPAGSKPASYTLQNGEFVYCIARRFNVDPDEILALNGIVDSETIFAGLVIKIPQTGNPFPGSRVWHNHPDTYTVDSASETIYSVACYYGDIDPAVIAQANGLSVNASLTVGQQLRIP